MQGRSRPARSRSEWRSSGSGKGRRAEVTRHAQPGSSSSRSSVRGQQDHGLWVAARLAGCGGEVDFCLCCASPSLRRSQEDGDDDWSRGDGDSKARVRDDRASPARLRMAETPDAARRGDERQGREAPASRRTPGVDRVEMISDRRGSKSAPAPPRIGRLDTTAIGASSGLEVDVRCQNRMICAAPPHRPPRASAPRLGEAPAAALGMDSPPSSAR